MRRLNILLLTVEPRTLLANTLRDHIAGLKRHSRHHVYQLQNYLALVGAFRGMVKAIPTSFPLEHFEALVVHYSNYMALPEHMDRESRERIRRYTGLKVAFIQDEYRTVDATVNALREMNFDVLFTCVPEMEIEKVYPAAALPRLRKVTTLTGFVPEDLLHVAAPPVSQRPVDVGYRARVLPYWLGRLGAEKWQIVEKFKEASEGRSLNLDISCDEGDRLYGRKWTDFLLSCKAVLGVESGASIFDFTGDLQRQVDQYVMAHPASTFEEVHARFLAPHEGRIALNQISPRCFEAAALRTAMILYEGEYSGILQPWRHYVPLRKDFSNFEEVVAALRDDGLLQGIADRAYREVALDRRYAYPSFVERFDEIVAEESEARASDRASMAAAPRAGSLRLRAHLWRARLLPAFIDMLARAYARAVPERVKASWRPFLRRYFVNG